MLNWNTFSIAKTYNGKNSFEPSPICFTSSAEFPLYTRGCVPHGLYDRVSLARKHGGHFLSAWFARFPSQVPLSTGPRHTKQHPQTTSTKAELYLPGRKVREEAKRLAYALARRFTLSQNGYGTSQSSDVTRSPF